MLVGWMFGAVGQDGLHPEQFALGRDSGCGRIQPATVRGEGGGAVTLLGGVREFPC